MNAAKYYIYRNLHTGGFSIKLRGKVVDRSNSFIANDISFKINEVGRQRVIMERQKNVHAYIVADEYTFSNNKEKVDGLDVITYNPYASGYFTCNGKEITHARRVIFRSGKCYLLER